MKAWVLHDIGNITLDDVPVPKPERGQVLVKVKAAGICGSDIPRIYSTGAHKMPLIPGHEFAGEVIGLGEGVGNKWLGKRVGVFPLIPCKRCTSCNNRIYEMCRNYNYLGSRCNGGFAEYAAVPEWNLIDLGGNVKYEEAAMLEPMSVAVHAIRRVNPVPGDRVLVLGQGTIGELIVMFLIEMGIENIFVVGNKELQRDNMIKLGISKENYCDSRTQNTCQWIHDMTDGQGVDVAFECVGSNKTIAQSVDCAAPAGRVCVVGNPCGEMTFERNTYWKILRNQLIITGTWNSSFYGESDLDNIKDDWHYALSRLKHTKINPSVFITHLLSINELEHGLIIMRDKTEDYVKIMVH